MDLEVHHLQFRSKLADDALSILISPVLTVTGVSMNLDMQPLAQLIGGQPVEIEMVDLVTCSSVCKGHQPQEF